MSDNFDLLDSTDEPRDSEIQEDEPDVYLNPTWKCVSCSWVNIAGRPCSNCGRGRKSPEANVAFFVWRSVSYTTYSELEKASRLIQEEVFKSSILYSSGKSSKPEKGKVGDLYRIVPPDKHRRMRDD